MSLENLVEFLNRLPITSDCDRWMEELRAALLALFLDVDRIAININYYCNPLKPQDNCEGTTSVRFSSNGIKEELSVTSLRPEHITRDFEAETQKFVDLTKFHAPKYFHLFHESGQYMGSMIFFRSIEKSATSSTTLEAIAAIEPFIKYIYASFLAMQRSEDTFIAAFQRAQDRMDKEARFSNQEKKVMTYTLCGYSYKQIAAELDVSLNTVRTHIKSIHRKTATRSYSELFAKYFVPLAAE